MAKNKTKHEVMESLSKDSYSKKDVRLILHHLPSVKANNPSKLKKGDVYSMHVGTKKRPSVIIKIHEGLAYSIPLTTTKDEYYLCDANSRFWKESMFNKYLAVTKETDALDNFTGTYENTRHLNKVIKTLKLHLLELDL